MVFVGRIPSEQELINFYKEYSYGGEGNYLSPITIGRYNELLDEFEKHRRTNKILDVGCGAGYFLNIAKKRGWDVYGTEYSELAVEYCTKNGINMRKGVLNAALFTENDFDVITSFEVLEHINNPQSELGNIYSLLRPGGLFYFTTPNFNGLLRYYLKVKYNIIHYPEHLTYYTPKTINYILKRTGFVRKKLFTSGISITRLKLSQGKSDQKIISKNSDDEKLRSMTENNFFMKFIKRTVNFFLRITNKGLTIKGYYQK